MFMTDVSNASRTLHNHTLEWDTELLELFDIPINVTRSKTEEEGGETSTTLFKKSNSRRSRRSTSRPLDNYALNLEWKTLTELLYAEYGRKILFYQ
jgi:hypothetical protein